ncbi:zinc finger CCCH domain-containing protein ZFN-like [Hibiscus syriacus]|uniref:zinc finger CCCH domain-containing protein ZFN-like n=1 Tax=Hibiscus syriacus TaxID=106335 RepID=UPI0019251572|nr:zinc finger CCCH domain-containing protein ZFN-like [Hibiscus syriacus]
MSNPATFNFVHNETRIVSDLGTNPAEYPTTDVFLLTALQYYLKTGTCKFGATCKFHHPRDKAAIAGRVSLNILGYPLRPDETECVYYLRTGQYKFGSTCKFHHPQPTNMMVSLSGYPIYQTIPSPATPGQQSYPGGITNWSRASFIPSPRWQGPSSYAPLILPQGMVSVPGWNAYSVSFFLAYY